MIKRLRAALAAFRGETEEKTRCPRHGNNLSGDPWKHCTCVPSEDRYGDGMTWHDSGEVNVEIGPDGYVCAVWFRCRLLPWIESRVDACRRTDLREAACNDLPRIKAIVFEEKTDEE